MRCIKKSGTGGYQLNRSHGNPPQSPNDARSRWKSFGYKAELLQCLLDEQYQLCCYSELRADEEGLGYHLEHIENKSQYPLRTFDYRNLAACALQSNNDLPKFKAQGFELFGGHSPCKQAEVDLTHFISCLQLDCARFFSYLSDGRVIPSGTLTLQDRDRAEYTINLLNLNSPYLRTLRRNWWDELDRLYHEHIAEDMDVLHLAAVDLVPSAGKLSRFFSLTRQFYGHIAEEALQQFAPSLA